MEPILWNVWHNNYEIDGTFNNLNKENTKFDHCPIYHTYANQNEIIISGIHSLKPQNGKTNKNLSASMFNFFYKNCNCV